MCIVSIYNTLLDTVIAAVLRYPFDAERFIDEFLPKENKDRFYIKRLSSCEGEFA